MIPVEALVVAHIGHHPEVLAAAVALAGITATGFGLAAGARSGRVIVWIASGGLMFQGLHALEHLLQLLYWLAHPTEGPWLTPWAAAGRDMLAATAGGSAGVGNELLHLIGNGVFLAGLIALGRWAGRDRSSSLRWALVVQGVHVGEHLLLTATSIVFGHALGATTGFGLVTPGTTLATAVRVWSHFGLNLVATGFAVSAVLQLRLRRTELGRDAATGHDHALGAQWSRTARMGARRHPERSYAASAGSCDRHVCAQCRGPHARGGRYG